MKKMKIILVGFLILYSYNIYSQNFFPLELIDRACVKTKWYQYTGYPTNYSGEFYTNTYNTLDTLLDGEKFYLYKFQAIEYYFRYDQDKQKLFIYLPQYDSVYLAADFDLAANDTATFYLTGSPIVFRSSGIYDDTFMGKRVKSIQFTGDADIPHYTVRYKYTFSSEFGITFVYNMVNPPHPPKDESYQYLHSAIIDSVSYNPVLVRFDSTNIGKDRTLDTFPFVLRVYGSINDKNFIKNFHTEVEIERGDSIIYRNKFEVNPQTYYSGIEVDSSIIEVGDKFYYRVVYEDSSIFFNKKAFPDTGFLSFNIGGIISSTGDQANTFADFIQVGKLFPNPSNSASKLKFNLPFAQNISIKLYDFIGREADFLFHDTGHAGENEININLNNLSSGIYFLRFNASNFSTTQKLIIIK
jgi:hypothetical protein